MPTVVGALRTVPKGLEKRLEELKARGRIETLQDCCIVDIGLNTLSSPGDLWRLAVNQTPVKEHQMTPG